MTTRANQIADEVAYRLLRIKQWIVAICVLIPFTIWYFWLYRPTNRWLERMYRLRVPEAYGHRADPKFGDYRFGSWTKFVREMWNGRPDELIEFRVTPDSVYNYTTNSTYYMRRITRGRTVIRDWEYYKDWEIGNTTKTGNTTNEARW